MEVGVPLPIAPVQDDAVGAGVAPALAQGGDELVVAVSVAQHRAALCSLRDFGRDLIDQHHLSQAHLHGANVVENEQALCRTEMRGGTARRNSSARDMSVWAMLVRTRVRAM